LWSEVFNKVNENFPTLCGICTLDHHQLAITYTNDRTHSDQTIKTCLQTQNISFISVFAIPISIKNTS